VGEPFASGTGFTAFGGRVDGGVAGFGMDIVRGLSDLGGSELFCGLFESDLNNFCCMLRMLVAMIDVHVQGHTRGQHAFAMVFHNRHAMTSSIFERASSIPSEFTGSQLA
jgi:hypothetical protein